MKYQPVIGLEVHVELNTKSKMFCRCSADYFGKEPNTHTCPVCLGLPGALPMINEEAIKKCLSIGLALNCQVAQKSLFERKNYFYPDLPKGYQISQYRWPLCANGWLEVEGDDGKVKKVRINRVHQEEDTGKLTHIGGETLIDFNRSGVPLVEIVTEPDFTCSSQVKNYAKQLQVIFQTIGVSQANMERGDMRLEANVSMRLVGESKLPSYRVEIKNINSFNFMVDAIEYEIKRQVQALRGGKVLTQETRGWSEDRKETYLQRGKEEAHDYRYFPEPDLPTILEPNQLSKLEADTYKHLTPLAVKQSVLASGASVSTASTIAFSPFKSTLYMGAVPLAQQENIPLNQLGSVIANTNFGTEDINLVPKFTSEVINRIRAKSSGIISDEEELERLAKEVISKNAKAAEDYKGGKEAALQVLIGAMMEKTAGKAEPSKVKNILTKLLLEKV